MYKEFPNNYDVMGSYMYALSGIKNKENAEKLIPIAEKLLKSDYPYGAIQVLCHTYKYLGNVEKAKEYAWKAPIHWITSNELLRQICEGEEALGVIQSNIVSLIDIIDANICALVDKCGFNNNEKRYCYNFSLKLFELLYEDNDFNFYYNRTTDIYFNLARCDAEDKNTENCMKNLSLSAQHAIEYILLPDEKQYTSFLVNKQKHQRHSTSASTMENDARHILNHIQDKIFDFCREDERFKAIEENLKKYAN